MRLSLLPFALLGILSAGPVAAQRIVTPGDTVQVALRSGGQTLRGVLRAASADGITLRLWDGEDRILPASAVRSMNMLDGRTQPRGQWARGGFVVGMLAGTVIRVMETSDGSGFHLGRTSAAAILGGLGGAVFGLAISWNFENNHWIAARTPGPDTESVSPRRSSAALVAGTGAESTVLIGVRLRR